MKRAALICGKLLLLLAVLAAAALPALYTNSIYGYLPVLALAVSLLLSFLCLLRLRQSIRVETDAESVECVRGGSVNVGLRITNRSRLLCPRSEARLTISDLFGLSDSERSIRFLIGGKGTADLGLDMDMNHIGVYRVGLEQIALHDFFGVFRLTLPAAGNLTALVTPRLRPMDEFQFSGEETREASHDTRVTVVGGADYTGVREYALGDPMKQIHWKLSAHSREYVTKLQESSRQQEFAVVLDFAAEQAEREQLMELNDCLIETALSLIDEISRHDAGCLLLYAERTGSIGRSVPKGPESVAELLRAFAFITPDAAGNFPDALHILRQEARTAGRATNVLVVTSRVTEELLREMQNIKLQRRSPELFYIVPAEWTRRDLETAAARLRTLEELEIPHYFLSSSENH